MTPGYIYVLAHPSDSNLYKIGITTREPEQRLSEHNRDCTQLTGRIAKETGQKWELKEYHPVPDPYWAEAVFWSATGLADIPFRRGIEVETLEWNLVQTGLDAAKNAGVRPPPGPLPDYVYANAAWMNKRLQGRGITLAGKIRSKSVKSTFRCSNGHEWRATPNDVAIGEGCPTCESGARDSEDIERALETGVLCLLINPDSPGFIKIALTTRTVEQCLEENAWGDWQLHRYRHVEEPALAESLISDLLGLPTHGGEEPIEVDLSIAEQAFRDLHPRMTREIALAQRPIEERRLSG